MLAENTSNDETYPALDDVVGIDNISTGVDSYMRNVLNGKNFFNGFSSDSNLDDFREKLVSDFKVYANKFLNNYRTAQDEGKRNAEFKLAAKMIWMLDEGRRQFDDEAREGIYGALVGSLGYRGFDREGSHLREDRRTRNKERARGVTSFGVLEEHDDFIKGFEKEVEYIRKNNPRNKVKAKSRSKESGFFDAMKSLMQVKRQAS